MKGTEKVIISDDAIRIQNLEKNWVMHKAEKSLMYRLAEIVTKILVNIGPQLSSSLHRELPVKN
jgi:hypothetical protein